MAVDSIRRPAQLPSGGGDGGVSIGDATSIELSPAERELQQRLGSQVGVGDVTGIELSPAEQELQKRLGGTASAPVDSFQDKLRDFSKLLGF